MCYYRSLSRNISKRTEENYRLLEADLTQPNRETRLLELDNQFHRKAFEITGLRCV